MRNFSLKLLSERNTTLSGLVAFGVVLLLALGCFCPPPKERTSSNSSEISVPPLPTSNAAANEVTKKSNKNDKPDLELVKATWKTGGFGAIALWEVTVKNNTDKQLGDIKFRTQYVSETGNIVSKGGVDGLLGKDTIEKIVPAKKTRTFDVNDGFVSEEAHTAGFELVSWRVVP